MENFFQFYRKLLAEGLNKFLLAHSIHEEAKDIRNAIYTLLDLDYEGDELHGVFNSYESLEFDINDKVIESAEDFDYNVHDCIVDFLCDHFDVKLEKKEYEEITKNIINCEELKKFIEEKVKCQVT